MYVFIPGPGALQAQCQQRHPSKAGAETCHQWLMDLWTHPTEARGFSHFSACAMILSKSIGAHVPYTYMRSSCGYMCSKGSWCRPQFLVHCRSMAFALCRSSQLSETPTCNWVYNSDPSVWRGNPIFLIALLQHGKLPRSQGVFDHAAEPRKNSVSGGPSHGGSNSISGVPT